MRRPSKKVLLVEGKEDLRVIPELVEANGVAWGNSKETAIVFIKEFGGVEQLLEIGVIETEIKEPGRECIGIIVDANGNLPQRWNSVRSRCLTSFPSMPSELPPDGLVVENTSNQRIGVWIMPDNQHSGMLETFLKYLVPDTSDALFAFAQQTTSKVKIELSAPYKDVDETKATIYTWLAWQDEPGRQLHDAVKHRILDPTREYSKPFLKWFRKLYKV